MKAHVDHFEQLSEDIISVWFRPAEKIRYQAGQYIELSLENAADNDTGRRWFTLSSSPTEKLLSVTTRFSNPSSAFKTKLRSLKPGSIVNISQPMGDFVLPIDKHIGLLFIAIGMGITPVRSIIKDLIDRDEKRNIRIIHFARKPSDFIFSDIFEAFKIERVLTRAQSTWHGQTGQPNFETIKQLYSNLDMSNIYLSGPEKLVAGLTTQLKTKTKSLIISDEFPGYSNI